jgi:hypothetical protein
MPIFASNFASNSLSGTARVVNGFANITLPTIPYALEGDKTFVIKIRKDSITGDVLATSPVLTFRDNSSFVSLTANVSSVAEGNLVAFTLVTTNAVNGANLFYSVFPVTANVTAGDFTANTGTFTITNNAGTFALRANADVSLSNEDGETFRVQLRTTDSVGNVVFTTSNVVILDTYKTYNVLSFVESSASPIVEGSNVTFTFTATNIPNGTILYYNTTGNLTNFSSNTGSFVMNSTSNTIVISNPQVPTNALRTYNVVVRDGSAQGAIVATSNTMVVLDGGLLYMSATGGDITDSGGYRTHTFTTSSNLVISQTGANPTYSTISYLIVGGNGGTSSPPVGGQYGGGGGGGVLVGNVNLTTPGSMTIQIGAVGGTGPYTSYPWGSIIGPGSNGGNTTISHPGIAYNIYALGGGGGGGGVYPSPGPSNTPGSPGGSGGGGVLGTGGGSAVKPVITNATSYGNPGGYGYSGWGGGGGGGASANPSPASTPGGGTGVNSYSGGPAPARLANEGSGGYGLDATPLGFPGGPYGAGLAGNGPQLETVRGSIAIIKYVYVAGPTFTSITSSTNFGAVAGSNVILTLNTLNLSNNSVLYYSTVGNVISSDFVSGNTGSFRSTGNATTITLATNSNIPERFFQLQLNLDGIGEAAAITSNIITIRPPVTFSAETLAIGGGGSGAGGAGNAVGGSGGGAGGLILTNVTISSGTNYTISVPGSAAGGTYPATRGNDGSNTILSGGSISITAVGGAAGISQNNPNRFGRNGGSGSGGRFEGGTPTASLSGGNGYGFPSPTQQGYPGGTGTGTFPGFQGGGGGAGGEGTPGVSNGYGGLGIYSLITGANVQYAGGGGGGSLFPGQQGGAGQFGGGSGFAGAGGAANVNTGGGGGGAGRPGGSDETVGGVGGSGIVVLAYPNTLPNVFVVSGNVQISTNTISRAGYLVHRIIGGTGTITFL